MTVAQDRSATNNRCPAHSAQTMFGIRRIPPAHAKPRPAKLPPLDLLLAFGPRRSPRSRARGAERFVTQSAMSRQIRARRRPGRGAVRRRHRAGAHARRAAAAAPCDAGALARRGRRAPRAGAARGAGGDDDARLASLVAHSPPAALRARAPGRGRAAGRQLRAPQPGGRRLRPRDPLRPRAGSGEGVPLFGETAQPVCSPGAAGAGPPLQPADLAQHTLLQVQVPAESGMPLEWAPWLQAVGLPTCSPRRGSPSAATARR